jgi:hypothetical protein
MGISESGQGSVLAELKTPELQYSVTSTHLAVQAPGVAPTSGPCAVLSQFQFNCGYA